MFCGHGGCNDPSEQPGPSPHQCLPGRPQSPLEYLHICHIHVCVFIGGWVLLPMVGQRGPTWCVAAAGQVLAGMQTPQHQAGSGMHLGWCVGAHLPPTST